MSKTAYRILLAEDDLNLGLLLVDYLESEGFEVRLCKDGELALTTFKNQTFDLCLLDIMMPKRDGFSLAKEIRALNPTVPLLFITARSLKEDKLKAYGLGADDYITKPFDEEELLWKLKALLRRVSEPQKGVSAEPIPIGDYTLEINNLLLCHASTKRRITEKECRILHYLSQHRNQVVKREALLEALWGENDYFIGRSLDVFITKIRKYLKEDPNVQIENVFGVGFVLNVIDR